MTRPAPLLEVDAIEVIYGGTALALHDISLTVGKGEIVCLLGSNGAGKSTTLKAISNLLRAERGFVTRGRVLFEGRRVDGGDPADLVRQGVAQVLEGRRLFTHLTVEENLRVGAYARRDAVGVANDLSRVYEYFPQLQRKRGQRAGYLSGGEQQMVAIGRALMARPRLMVLDEPSMGLAPLVVKDIFAIIQRLNREEGVSILLAEQSARRALAIVDYGYVLEDGHVRLSGSGESLRADTSIQRFYLGFGKPEDGAGPSAPLTGQ